MEQTNAKAENCDRERHKISFSRQIFPVTQMLCRHLKKKAIQRFPILNNRILNKQTNNVPDEVWRYSQC